MGGAIGGFNHGLCGEIPQYVLFCPTLSVPLVPIALIISAHVENLSPGSPYISLKDICIDINPHILHSVSFPLLECPFFTLKKI